MKGREPSQLQQELIYAEHRGLLDDPVGRAVQQSLGLGIEDRFSRTHLDRVIRKDVLERARCGPFEPPVGLDRGGCGGRGDVELGLDALRRPVLVPSRWLGAHGVTVAGSGAGKTTRLMALAGAVIPRVPGVWLCDCRKREFISLTQRYPEYDLIICPARALRLNPLQPPSHVPPATWATSAARMLVAALALPPRASKLLSVAIMELYHAPGNQPQRGGWPTLFDLREAIAADRSANAQARLAFLDAIDPVLLSIGEVFRYRVGWSAPDLARRRITFLLDATSDVERDLILNTLLLMAFTDRLYQGRSNAPMDLWIAIDEAARVISPANATGGIADLLGLVRGAGIGIDLSTQTSDIAPAVLSNTAIKLVGRTGSATDSDAIAAAMGMSASQRQALRDTLAPGQFVIQLGEGPWRKPFVLTIPHPRNVSPMKASPVPALPAVRSDPDGLPSLLALPVIEAVEYRGWGRSGIAAATAPAPSPSSAPSDGLTDDERRLLAAVVAGPCEPASRYPKLAQMSPSKAKAMRDALELRGLIRITKVNTSARGRSSLIVEPTPAGIDLMKGPA